MSYLHRWTGNVAARIQPAKRHLVSLEPDELNWNDSCKMSRRDFTLPVAVPRILPTQSPPCFTAVTGGGGWRNWEGV